MPSETFVCPKCQHQLRWSPEVAGLEIPCKHCSAIVKVPDLPASQDPVDAYDLADPDDIDNNLAAAGNESHGRSDAPSDSGDRGHVVMPSASTEDDAEADAASELFDLADNAVDLNDPKAGPLVTAFHNGHCPNCQQTLSKDAVICTGCGTDLRTGTFVPSPPKAPLPPKTKAGKRDAAREKAALEEAERLYKKDTTYPLILAGMAAGLTLVDGLALAPLSTRGTGAPALTALVEVWMAIALGYLMAAPLLAAGLFAIAQVFHAEFDELKTPFLKIIPVACLAQATGLLVQLTLQTAGWLGGNDFLYDRSFAPTLFIPEFLVFVPITMWLMNGTKREAITLFLVNKGFWIVLYALFAMFGK